MKIFLAVYTGSRKSKNMKAWMKLSPQEQEARTKLGIAKWQKWGMKNKKYIINDGGPLGKTIKVDRDGITDYKNNLTGFVLIKSKTAKSAAKLFMNHPHFAIFPGDAVEIVECLPIPK
jgi:ribosomal protein S17